MRVCENDAAIEPHQRYQKRSAVILISRVPRLTLRLALLALVPVLAWPQVAMVHVTSCGPQSFPSTCSIPSTGSGNLIVVGIQMSANNATTISSVTDSAGNVYAEAGAARAIDTVAGTVADIWYAKASVAGTTSLTISPSASTSNGLAVIWEFSGVDPTAPLDQVAVLNNQASTSVVSGAAVTVTSSIEAIVSIAVVGNSVSGIASGNAFVNDSTLQGNGWAHLITSSTGTYSAQWTPPAGTYAASTASFKAASGGPNFTVSAAPASQTVTAGTNAVYTVNVSPSGGFTGTVSLGASGLPSGATASFNPSSVTTSGSSTLTVGTAGSTSAASYPLTITGTSGSLTNTATATLVVSTSSGSTACDVNKDGLTNVVDVQVSINNYLSCPATAFQTFVSQVVTGVLSSCPVTTGIHTVLLSWTASTTSGVTYNVYRATTSGGYNYTTPLNTTPISGTSFVDCNVALGQPYYYVIRAVDGSGNQSVSTTEVTVTIPSS